jgi:hypothetical protein
VLAGSHLRGLKTSPSMTSPSRKRTASGLSPPPSTKKRINSLHPSTDTTTNVRSVKSTSPKLTTNISTDTSNLDPLQSNPAATPPSTQSSAITRSNVPKTNTSNQQITDSDLLTSTIPDLLQHIESQFYNRQEKKNSSSKPGTKTVNPPLR